MAGSPRVAFAGDRAVAVDALDHLVAQGVRPVALLLGGETASHHEALLARCSDAPPQLVFRGAEFRTAEALGSLADLDLDVLLSVHFPFLIPRELLAMPRLGCFNLHPAFLPYGLVWHTVTWAILEDVPIGATLHMMDEGIDTGDIVHQRELAIGPGDVAGDLYPRLFRLELEVLKEAWPQVAAGTFRRTPQASEGTLHRKRDLLASGVQRLELDETTTARDVLRRLRALTTSNVDEAAYFEEDGARYSVQVRIVRQSE